MSKLVYLIPLFPLLGFLINGLGRKNLSKSLIGMVGSGAVLASFVVSVLVFLDVKTNGASVVTLFPFIDVKGLVIPFAFQVDQLSSLFLLIITGIGFLIHLYSLSNSFQRQVFYINKEFDHPTQNCHHYCLEHLDCILLYTVLSICKAMNKCSQVPAVY